MTMVDVCVWSSCARQGRQWFPQQKARTDLLSLWLQSQCLHFWLITYIYIYVCMYVCNLVNKNKSYRGYQDREREREKEKNLPVSADFECFDGWSSAQGYGFEPEMDDRWWDKERKKRKEREGDSAMCRKRNTERVNIICSHCGVL